MSSTLTAAEIASMRDSLEDVSLPDSCNILSGTITADGQGGGSTAWGTTYSGTACRLDAVQMRGRELGAGAAVQAFHAYVLTVPYSTPITNANRVEVGGYTYKVKNADYGKSWSLGKTCEVERV